MRDELVHAPPAAGDGVGAGLAPVVLVLFHVCEPIIGLLPLVILLFPDGHPPSRRWRWVVRGYLALAGPTRS